MREAKPIRLLVLLSGKGSNLQAIIKAIENGQLNATITAVLSDKQDAGGLLLAKEKQIPQTFIDPAGFSSREAFDQALLSHIETYAPDYLVLAGFMRILSSAFVKHFHGKLLNIHPSLLPNYKGLNTHQRVLDAGDTWHGCSVHFVSEQLDGGPLIACERLRVDSEDNHESLKAKVQDLEHQLYPKVLSWLEQGLVKLQGDSLLCDPGIDHERNIEAPTSNTDH